MASAEVARSVHFRVRIPLRCAHTPLWPTGALREPTTIPLLSSVLCMRCSLYGCLSHAACVHVFVCSCSRVSVGSHRGLEARAFRALPLLCAKRLRLPQLIYIPNNVMATRREGHFLWISFLAIDVTSHLEREVGRGARRNRRALDTACTLG